MARSHVPRQYFQGKPIGYNIIYNPDDLESDFKFVMVNYAFNVYISLANKQNDSFKVHVSESTQSYFNDLQVYTLYVIRVSAVKDIGEGPKSNAFTARTMASGKLIILIRN